MKNNKRSLGFGILQALFVLFVITIALTGIIMIVSRAGANQEVASLRLRIMRVTQTAKLILSKPESYLCNQVMQVAAGSPPGTPPTNHWSCNVDNAVIDRLNVSIPNANCPVGNFCGIQVGIIPRNAPVVVVPPDPNNVPKIDLSVRYTGKLLGLKFAANVLTETVNDIIVPPEAYVGRTGVCGIDKNGDGTIDASDGYLYKGVNANGADDCRALPGCADGKTFRGFQANGDARCAELNDGLNPDANGKFFISCANDQFMNEFRFDPTSNFASLVKTCTPRLDPCAHGNTCPPN